MTAPAPAPAGEILYGLRAIARFLGVSERQALSLKEKGSLPHWHEGRTICCRPATLRLWFATREAAGRSTKATS